MSTTLTLLTSAAAVTAAAGWAWTAQRLRHRTTVVENLEHDGLTGLWRREGFEHRAPAALAAGNAVALLDLDGFKQINDTHGHPAGDAVLRALAGRLAAELPDDALVARLGGDEFAVITELEFPAVHDQLEQLTDALTAPVSVPGVGTLPLGVSMGVAWLCDLPIFAAEPTGTAPETSPSSAVDGRSGAFWPAVLAEALSAADAAMYAAKALRHDWRLFDPDLDPVRPAARICHTPARRYREHGRAALATAAQGG